MNARSHQGLLRDSLVSLSLANLVMLPEWTELGKFHSSAAYYLVQLPPPLAADWATLINTLAVSGLALLILRGVRGPDRKQVWPLTAGVLLVLGTAYGVCVFCLQGLNALAENWAWLGEVYNGTFVWFATMLIAAHMAARNLDRAVRAAPSLLLVFLPVAVLNIGLLAERVIYPPGEPQTVLREEAAVAPPAEAKLVWLVFDELSEPAIDAAAAHGVAFKEFRRFRETAVHVSDARSPAIWTLAALPALTTGRPVCDASADSLDSLRLEVQDEAEPSRWEARLSIFEQAAMADRAVGIVGWYHPYCRIFGKFATTCVSGADEMSIFRGWFAFADSIGAWHSALRQWTRSIDEEAHAAGAPLDQLRDAQQRRSRMTLRLLDASEKAARDDRLGFVMLHLPVPHPPGLAIKGQGKDGEADYFSNMKLADRTLGMVRTAMEEEGTWDAATIIVIADHGLRDFWNELSIWTTEEEQFRQSLDALHVPFLVKMPGQDEPLDFDASISSTAIYDLSVEVLGGRVTTSEQALQWFERNAGSHPPACLSR